MDPNLENIKLEYLSKIETISTDDQHEQLRIEIFGRNGKINALFSEIKNISPEKLSFKKSSVSSVARSPQQIIFSILFLSQHSKTFLRFGILS